MASPRSLDAYLTIVSDTRALRDRLGQFISATERSDFMRAENQRIAQIVQADAVANLESSIVRPNVSSGRLVKVTADPRNRYADQFGWGVGIRSFLDSSVAKYWRTIEEGSAVTWTARGGMIGLELIGKWGALGEYPGTTPHGGGTGQTFKPFGKKMRKQALKRGYGIAYVKKEIEPHSYYENAFRDADPGPLMAAAAVKALTETFRAEVHGGR